MIVGVMGLLLTRADCGREIRAALLSRRLQGAPPRKRPLDEHKHGQSGMPTIAAGKRAARRCCEPAFHRGCSQGRPVLVHTGGALALRQVDLAILQCECLVGLRRMPFKAVADVPRGTCPLASWLIPSYFEVVIINRKIFFDHPILLHVHGPNTLQKGNY